MGDLHRERIEILTKELRSLKESHRQLREAFNEHKKECEKSWWHRLFRVK
jgi:hypothetical protein